MTYNCFVCGKEDMSQTSFMNHLRMKQDDKHQEVWRKIKGDKEVETEDDDSEEHLEPEQEGDKNLVEEYKDNVKQLKETKDNESDSEYVDFVEGSNEEVSEAVDELVDNGFFRSRQACLEELEEAEEKGYSKVRVSDGDLKK